MSDEKPHWHRAKIEPNVGLFTGLTAIAILIGGLVEIVPMYTVQSNAPVNAELVAPYTPLELVGRDIYVREGCYNCHSQMVRPMRAETMRYGEWSRAAEYVHDRPFQLGSRRIGPDLHRVGGKYPDAWHYEHMMDPRATSPGSIMPPYSWLGRDTYTAEDAASTMRAIARMGDHYSEAEIANVAESLNAEATAIVERLAESDIDCQPDHEIVALIAYLQRLGTDHQAVIYGADGPPSDEAPAAEAPTDEAAEEAPAEEEAAPEAAAPEAAAPEAAAPEAAAPEAAAPEAAAPEAAVPEAAPEAAAAEAAAPADEAAAQEAGQ